MLESIRNIYQLMCAVNLFPEVMLASLAAYFIVRQRYDSSAKWAVWVPVGISFIGQLAYDWPHNTQDGFTCFTMGWIQAGMALGIYSFADKYGLMDRAGQLVQKKMESTSV